MDIKNFVVDYSVSHPNPANLKLHGFIGVVRYLGWDFRYEYKSAWNSRTISPEERDNLFLQVHLS